jgi:hypothetical protein
MSGFLQRGVRIFEGRKVFLLYFNNLADNVGHQLDGATFDPRYHDF